MAMRIQTNRMKLGSYETVTWLNFSKAGTVGASNYDVRCRSLKYRAGTVLAQPRDPPTFRNTYYKGQTHYKEPSGTSARVKFLQSHASALRRCSFLSGLLHGPLAHRGHPTPKFSSKRCDLTPTPLPSLGISGTNSKHKTFLFSALQM
jgi:hypothetical protein